MVFIRRITGLFITLSILFPPLVDADSYRCGRKIVSTGDSSGELLRVCGEPYHKDRGRAEVEINGLMKKVSVERWHYKKSRRSLDHVIIVYKGNVEAVIVGNR